MAGDYAGDGRGQVFVHPHHNHQHADDGCCLYHVPQHSRREKLRFPAEESTAALASSLPLLYPANAASTLANLLPSSYYNVHSADNSGAYHFGAGTALRQIHPQGFSLSLSPAETSSLRTFTVYAAVLNKSGFVEPARQLLDELCQFGRGVFDACREPPEIFSLEREAEKLAGAGELQWKKIKLVSILDEVYRSYRIYYQQVEAVIASFETVAGFSTAAPFVSMALKAMSTNFASVKNAISSHLSHLNKEPGKGLGTRESSCFGFLASGDQACSRRGNQGSVTFGQPHGWRPQRGLPEHAVAVLKTWLFEHFLHPYPTDGDKQMLAKQTGLSRNQVSNWFINARVRLWKPMVEELHTMELHQLHSSGPGLNTDFQPPPAAFSGDQPLPENNSMQRNHSKPPTGMELRNLEEPCNFIFNGFTGNNQPLMDRSVISLTLGLRQNNGTMYLPEAEPVNITRRFGAEECGDAYVVGGFEGEEMRGYGKEIGGRSVLDFVG